MCEQIIVAFLVWLFHFSYLWLRPKILSLRKTKDFFVIPSLNRIFETTSEDTHARKSSNKIWLLSRLFVSLWANLF